MTCLGSHSTLTAELGWKLSSANPVLFPGHSTVPSVNTLSVEGEAGRPEWGSLGGMGSGRQQRMAGHVPSMRTGPGLPGFLLHPQDLVHSRCSVYVCFQHEAQAVPAGLPELSGASWT